MKILGIDTGLGNAFLVKTPKAQTTKLKNNNNNNTSASETKPQLKASAQQKKQSTR